MTQNARVIRLLEGGKAEVEVIRQSACGNDCSKCSGKCPEMKTGPIRAEAVNRVGAQPNDRVIIEGEFRQFMHIALIVYALPLFLFFAVYAVAVLFSVGEGMAALCGIGGFVVGVLFSVWYNKRCKGQGAMAFTITEVL